MVQDRNTDHRVERMIGEGQVIPIHNVELPERASCLRSLDSVRRNIDPNDLARAQLEVATRRLSLVAAEIEHGCIRYGAGDPPSSERFGCLGIRRPTDMGNPGFESGMFGVYISGVRCALFV